MSLAVRAAALAGLVAASGLYATILLGGSLALAGVAVAGFLMFGLGAMYGHSGLTVVGLGAVVLGAGLATDRSTGGIIAAVVIGVAASATLVATDASWWLRRDAHVDPAVISGLAKAFVPVWATGAVLAAAVIRLSGGSSVTIWLLPAGIITAAGLVAIVGWVTLRRHRRHDPQSDRRASAV